MGHACLSTYAYFIEEAANARVEPMVKIPIGLLLHELRRLVIKAMYFFVPAQ